MRIRGLLACAVLACLAPSCKTWARVPEHKVTIVADNQVKKGSDFSFCVTLTDAQGAQVYKAEYQYKISWVGLEGSTSKGKTGVLESVRVRGEKGTVTLHILGYDAQDNYGEVAKQSFQVQ